MQTCLRRITLTKAKRLFVFAVSVAVFCVCIISWASNIDENTVTELFQRGSG